MQSFKFSKYIVKTSSKDKRHELLFNTRTGALIQVPRDSRLKLSKSLLDVKKGKSIFQKRLFNILYKGGFILDYEIDEYEEIRKIYTKKTERSFLMLSIMPTLDCNMKCLYCFEKHRNISMNKNDFIPLLKFIDKRLSKIRELSIDWYGGEPLLEFDTIVNLQKHINYLCHKYKTESSFSMTTNGYLLTPNICDILVGEDIKTFQITVDGPREIHNSRRFLKSGEPSFDIIVSNLSYAIKKSTVNIRVNIDKSNIKYMKELLVSFSSYGLQSANALIFKAIVPADGIDRFKNTYSISEFSKVSQDVLDLAIEMGFNVYFEPRNISEFCIVDLPEQWIIGADLYVYKCADHFNTQKDSIGKILKNGSLELNDNINLWRSKKIFDDDDCRKCIYLPQCMGGCSLKKLIHRKDWCPEEKYNLGNYVQHLHSLTFIDDLNNSL